MKTPRALFSFGAACLLLTGTSLFVARQLWQNRFVSDAWFAFAVLVCIASAVLALTICRRSVIELFRAIGHDVSESYHGLIRIFRWRIAHPLYWKFVHYRAVLSRRWRLILTMVVSVAALATIITFLIHPTFAGTARIREDIGQPDIVNSHAGGWAW